MEIRSHDILLVGGGGAGLRAAIAAAEFNPKLSIAVVSKVYPMRSHTVSAEGGAAGVAKPDDSLDEHAYDTISGGDWMCDQDAVEAFVKEAPLELLQLERWGCPWNREPDGHIAVRAFGGMKKKRTWFAADKTGFHMLHTLFQTSLRYKPITRYDEYFVTRLLVDENTGRAQGVVAIEIMSGRIQAITAKAVILCTGGCGKVFPFTTNANIKNGDGMALAQRAGAPLKDMEYLQYHPTGLPFTVVPLRGLEIIRNLRVDIKGADEYLERSGGKFFYFVSRETVDPAARLHARMIFYNGEDPATGSAAGCAAAWMVANGVAEQEEHVLIEQGVEMQRPSRIFVRASRRDDRVVNVRVGGNVVEVIRGEVTF